MIVILRSPLLFHVELLLQLSDHYVMRELPEAVVAGTVLYRAGHIRTLVINSKSHLVPS